MLWRRATCFFMVIIVVMFNVTAVIRPVEATASSLPEIQGKAAILIDEGSGRVLYQKNANRRMSPASLTKIMTALLVIEDDDIDQRVYISKRAAETGESSIWLEAGETLSRRELLYALMLSSANDAAVALAESVSGTQEKFVQKMNARARQLGLMNTHFCNPHGLEAPGHYTTAYDLAFLTRQAMTDPLFRKVVATRAMEIPWAGHPWNRQLFNKNRLLYRYRGAIGVKTGYTKGAGNCLVGAAQRGPLKLIVVVLNSSQVYEDAEKLLDYAFVRYQGYAIKLDEKHLKVNVKGGRSRDVRLKPERDVVVAVTPSEKKLLSYRVSVPGSVRAPVKRGAALGSIRILLKGKEIGSVNLLARSEVGRRPPLWIRLVAGIRLLFHRIFG